MRDSLLTPHRQGLHRYLKKSQSASNTHNCNGHMLAEFVELNIEEHLSEPEFHAESNNSGLIPPN